MIVLCFLNIYNKYLSPTTFLMPWSSNVLRSPPTSQKEEERPKIFCTPYVKVLSEELERWCCNINIRLVFRSGQTLRSLLEKVKKKIPQEGVTGVIFRVQCECGIPSVGKTGRSNPLQVNLYSQTDYTALQKDITSVCNWTARNHLKLKHCNVKFFRKCHPITQDVPFIVDDSHSLAKRD